MVAHLGKYAVIVPGPADTMQPIIWYGEYGRMVGWVQARI